VGRYNAQDGEVWGRREPRRRDCWVCAEGRRRAAHAPVKRGPSMTTVVLPPALVSVQSCSQSRQQWGAGAGRSLVAAGHKVAEAGRQAVGAGQKHPELQAGGDTDRQHHRRQARLRAGQRPGRSTHTHTRAWEARRSARLSHCLSRRGPKKDSPRLGQAVPVASRHR
jgi:hypothetical protein